MALTEREKVTGTGWKARNYRGSPPGLGALLLLLTVVSFTAFAVACGDDPSPTTAPMAAAAPEPAPVPTSALTTAPEPTPVPTPAAVATAAPVVTPAPEVTEGAEAP